jgi:hypothetical protein
MTYAFSFKECLERAERISWRVEDLIGEGKALDFSRPFLPESLARTEPLTFLSADQQRTLNQIRGHAYLAIFGLVEEFILPFVLDHVRTRLSGDDYRARAFIEFAAEEAKHIHLFRRFREAFTENFGTPCEVIGPADAVAAHVLAHPPLSVALLTLHIEWMTQRHYLESVRHDEGLDPLFKDLLLHHWMEEHQHAHLDTLMVEAIAAQMATHELRDGVEGYVALGGFIDRALKQQAGFDLEALERATGKALDPAEAATFLDVQHQANRWTYIGSGMSHPKFVATLAAVYPGMRGTIAAMAPRFF